MAAAGGRPAPGLSGERAVVEGLAPRPADAVAPTPPARTAVPDGPPPLLDQLFAEAYNFDPFQAVRLLELAFPERNPVGREGPPGREAVRLRAHASVVFPPSAVYDLEPPTDDRPVPRLTVAYFGLYGPSGVLPRHYTELLLRLAREAKGPERTALRAWLDLFDHRMLSLFNRAWEKYRFWRAYERGEAVRPVPDTFTRALYSLAGLGLPPLRGRLWVIPASGGRQPPDNSELSATARHTQGADAPRSPSVLARIDDLALVRYAGLFAQRPPSAAGLELLLGDYFHVSARVEQFVPRWLVLEEADRTRLGMARLGRDATAGDRVRDVQGLFRVALGPLDAAGFAEFLPDRAPTPARKAFFLACHLVRLYAGAEYDFEVQLLLRAGDVPPLQLAAGEPGPRLGWNTWVLSGPASRDAGEAVFAGEALTRV
jgi:type VI secretion system protein ImpH